MEGKQQHYGQGIQQNSNLKYHHPVINIHLLDATKYHVCHAITFNINKILKWIMKIIFSFLPHTSTHQLEFRRSME